MKENILEMQLKELVSKENKYPIKRKKGFAVCYTRVSTQEQAFNNGSLETQLNLIKEYAERNCVHIVEYFGGRFESAKTDGRKEFMRMLEYVKKNKDVSFILVTNYDRFSRTGAAAGKLSEDLRKEGIIVKSILQEIDTSTATGRFQENMMHLMNNLDNSMKSDRTKVNTKEVMLKGYWPYAPPLGYENLNKKQRACNHKYVITKEGNLIKKVFQLKAEGILMNQEIIDKIKTLGLEIKKGSFKGIIINPFYAGYVTGNLLEGKLVKGKHPALIDLKTFLKANEVLQLAPTNGIPKVYRHEQVPLKVFAKDERSGFPFSGYATKDVWYYKTKNSPIPVNINAAIINRSFSSFLTQFEYNKKEKDALRKQLVQKLRIKLSNLTQEIKLTKKNISEKNNLLEKLEMKFLKDEISMEIYEKHASKIKSEITNLTKELQQGQIYGSNLEKVVEKCLEIAQNISHTWVTASFDNKQRLQQLVFPEGILYNKEKNRVRTLKVNSLFGSIPTLTSDTEEIKKGNIEKYYPKNASVDLRRIELLSKHIHHKVSTRLFLY